jgi:hypothetical protein
MKEKEYYFECQTPGCNAVAKQILGAKDDEEFITQEELAEQLGERVKYCIKCRIEQSK